VRERERSEKELFERDFFFESARKRKIERITWKRDGGVHYVDTFMSVTQSSDEQKKKKILKQKKKEKN
jgi:hypothetical protein